MQFTCSKTLLLEGISSVQKAVAVRSANPVLEGILVHAENNLILTGYDMEIGIRYTMPASIQKQGKIVINSKLFGDIIRRASAEEIRVEWDEQLNIQIQSGKSKFNVKGLSAEAYPMINEIPDQTETKELELDQKELRTLIRRTLFSVSSDVTRINLNGCFLRSTPEKLEMAGIDGFRVSLARHMAADGQKFPEMECIIPSKTLRHLMSLLEEEGRISLIYCNNQLLIDFGRTRISSRLITEAYMQYENVFPKTSQSEIILSRKSFLDALDRAALINSLDVHHVPVTLECKGPDLELQSSTQMGKFQESLEMEAKGEGFDIDFNPIYFMDVLKSIEDDKINILFNGSNGPAIVKPVEDRQDYLFLILPLRNRR